MKELTQDLKVVTRELKKLTKKVESLSTRAIKLEKKLKHSNLNIKRNFLYWDDLRRRI